VTGTSAVARFEDGIRRGEFPPAPAPAPPPAPDECRPLADSPEIRRFEDGIRRGLDPGDVGLRGPAHTTDHSFWRAGPCPVCRHTFRPGDPVWLEPDGDRIVVCHDSSALPCRSKQQPPVPARPEIPPEVRRFHGTADQLDEKIASLGIFELLPGHPLLAGGRRLRRTCVVCSHTFRPYELVAVCPCRARSVTCHLAAHRDAAAGLTCFDVLISKPGKHCPMSLQKL
jgi:hypothetical protein